MRKNSSVGEPERGTQREMDLSGLLP